MFDKTFDLKTLDGKNGFVARGLRSSDRFGYQASFAGDMNGDGINDMAVLASYTNNRDIFQTVYIIFGQKNFTSSFYLSMLNGINGFIVPLVRVEQTYPALISTAGDINNDGRSDLMISNPKNNGTVYIIFGQKAFSLKFNLSDIDGTNGFLIEGLKGHDHLGCAVSSVGDMNGDGVDDILIGASGVSKEPFDLQAYQQGVVYVLFGQKDFPKQFNLTNLTGISGFTVPGLHHRDRLGFSVSSTGDINGDGINDAILGVDPYGVDSGAYAVYVIFGQKNFSMQFDLSSLDGTNGFKIYSANTSEYDNTFGKFLSKAGDINGDKLDDILLGNTMSDAYVIFGQKNFPATFSLTNLNGVNGFIIPGLKKNYYTLSSVSTVGDINNDGKSDIVLAHEETLEFPNALSTLYVIFGDDSFPVRIDLNTLDGSNGFIVPFITTGLHHALHVSVCGGGDVNHDHIDDLILGVPGGDDNDRGAAYVVFGKDTAVPRLTNNNLLVLQGKAVLLTKMNINATDIYKSHSDLLIIPTNITHGQFEYVDQPNIGISNFTQHNISASMVQFRADNSYIAPSYSLSVRNKRNVTVGPFPAKITFHDAPRLIINQLSVQEGQLVMVSSGNLKGTETYTPLEKLWFSISEIQHGKFQVIMNVSNQSILEVTEFSQQDVTNSKIQFVHDGSENAPNYAVVVKDTELSSGEPQYAKIDFKANPPVLHSNNLLALQGKSVVLTTANLNATSSNNMPSPHLLIMVNNIRHGQFEYVSQPKIAINNFTQHNVSMLAVQFRADNSYIAPSYDVSVKNSWGMTIGPYSAKITFHDAPRLIKNQLTIQEGHSVLLTSDHLQATEDYTPSKNLIFSISNIQHGRFQMMLNESLLEVTEFYQNNLTDAKVQFKHDGSDIAPSYAVTVRDSELSSGSPSEAKINFIFNPPQLHQNKLLALQGKAVVLTEDNINATDTHTSNTDILIITSNVQHGQFEYVKQPETPIKNFTQYDISASAVQFRTDNSYIAPSYDISVQSKNITTKAHSAAITFHDAPRIINNQLTIQEGQSVFLTSSDLSAIEDYTPRGELIFSVSKIQYGIFQILLNTPNQFLDVVKFSQQNVTDDKIRFVHDGSKNKPNYAISVSDKELVSEASDAKIDFKLNPPIDDTLKIVFGTLGGLAVVTAMCGIGFFASKKYQRTEKIKRNEKEILEGLVSAETENAIPETSNTESHHSSPYCQLF